MNESSVNRPSSTGADGNPVNIAILASVVHHHSRRVINTTSIKHSHSLYQSHQFYLNFLYFSELEPVASSRGQKLKIAA